MNLNYFGILRAPTSWAKVSREMCLALIENKHNINIFERKGFLYDKSFFLDIKLVSRISDKFEYDITFTFENPITYNYLSTKKKIGFLTYETNLIPDNWIINANKYLNILFLPSKFVLDNFMVSGLKIPAYVLPYGYNQKIFKNKKKINIKTDKKIKYLTIINPHKREGLSKLLDGYKRAFSSKDDVCLIIKTNYIPSKPKIFEINIKEIISDYIKEKTNPEIIFFSGIYSDEEIVSLYNTSDCYISTSHGEGFGMTILEAMVTGLPVICPDLPAYHDFSKSGIIMKVDYKMESLNEYRYESYKIKSDFMIPVTESVSEKMLIAYKNIHSLKKSAKEKSTGFKIYEWNNIANKFINIIKND